MKQLAVLQNEARRAQLPAVWVHDMLPLTRDQPLLVLKIRRARRERHRLFKNVMTIMLLPQLQTHRAERRKRTSPAWICRGCGRTNSSPENWSLSRRIWSHGWCYTREGDLRCFPGLEPLLPLLRHPQTLCPAKRGKKDLIHVLNEGLIQPFNGYQALQPVFFVLSQLFKERVSLSLSFLIHSYLALSCATSMSFFAFS